MALQFSVWLGASQHSRGEFICSVQRQHSDLREGGFDQLTANHLDERLAGHVHLDPVNAKIAVLLVILFRHGTCQNDNIKLGGDQSRIANERKLSADGEQSAKSNFPTNH
jgi:hypothetical protein